MSIHLKKSGAEYFNPLTARSFEWDEKSGSIYFIITDSGGRSSRHEVVY